MLSFKLTMPNCASWDGKWSQENNLHYKTRGRLEKKKEEELDGQNFYYDFGDGWGANIKVEVVTPQEGRKRMKKSKGFSGYDWMIDEILKHGRILELSERIIHK